MGPSLGQSAEYLKDMSQGRVQAGACWQSAYEKVSYRIEYIVQLSAVLFMQKYRNLENFRV